MFESIIAGILSRFLGDYVEGLEAENLSLSIVGGNVVLENLRLKKEALADLEVPLVVKDGVLGHLELNIPWSSLGSKPAIARVSNIFLICGPSKPSEYDPEVVIKKQLETKKRSLQIAEMFASEIENDNDQKKAEASTSQQSLSYTQKMINTIVDNFQLFINDVHVRYEDDISHPGRRLAFGITLEGLQVQSTDRNWKAKFLTGQHELIHKLAELKNFALYLTPDAEFIKYSGYKEMRKKMEALIWKEGRESRHMNIVNPINGALRLVLNKNDLPDMKQPKIVADLLFSQLSVALAEAQYNGVMHISSYFAYYMRGIHYHEFRPNARIRPTEDARPWWRFALLSIRRDVREKRAKCTWESIKRFKADRLRYMELFKKKKGPNNAALTAAEAQELAAMEERLEVAHVLMFRDLAMASVTRDKRAHEKMLKSQQEQKQAGGGGWFGWVWKSAPEQKKEDVRALTTEQWRELYEMIKFGVDEEELAKSKVKADPKYVKMRINFMLEKGSLLLHAPDSSTFSAKSLLKGSDSILIASFEKFDVNVLKRETSLAVAGGVASVAVEDHFTRGAANPVRIVEVLELPAGPASALPGAESSELYATGTAGQFMSFRFDQRPLDGGADTRVSMAALHPLNITGGRLLLERIAKFFVHTADTTQLRLASSNTFEALKEQAEMSIKYALDNRKKLDVRVEVVAPNVCVPRNFHDDDCAMLVLNLGRLLLSSNFEKKESSVSTSEVSESPVVSEDFFYDSYDLHLTDICSYMTTRSSSLDMSNRVSLIEKFDVLVSMGVCTVPSAELPNIKIKASLPRLHATISPAKIGQLLAVLDGFVDPDEPGHKKPSISAAAAADKVESKNEVQELQSVQEQPADKQNNKMAVVECSINDITVEVFQFEGTKSERKERMILAVRLQGLSASVAQMSHQTQLQLQLRAFEVEDHFLPGAVRPIVSSTWDIERAGIGGYGSLHGSHEGGDALISISYTGIPIKSPLFDGTEHFAELAFNTMDVIVNRGTLLGLLALMNTITEEMSGREKAPEALPARESPAERAATSVADKRKSLTAGKGKLLDDAPHTLFGVALNVNRVGLTLNRSGEPFIYTGIRELEIGAQISTSSDIGAQGSLGKVEVTDCTPGVLYPDILSCLGDRVVDFSADIHNGAPVKGGASSARGRSPADHEGGQISVTLNVASVEAVFVMSVLMSVLDYVQELNEMKDLLSSAAERASEAASAVQESAAQTTKLLLFSVSVANPHVIVPVDSVSKKHLVANLGDIGLTNRIDSAGPGKYIDLTEISIRALNVKTVDPSAAFRPSCAVISDTNIDLTVSRAVAGNEDGDFPDLILHGMISRIHVAMSESQLQTMLNILNGNLMERSNTGKSDELLMMEKAAFRKRWSEAPGSTGALRGSDDGKISSKDELQKTEEKPKEEAEDKPVRLLYEVNMQLEQLSLEISRGRGWDGEGRSTSVASFAIQQQEVFASLNSDGSLEARYVIGSIVLKDERVEAESKFRRLITSAASGRSHRLLTASFKKEVTGEQVATVKIVQPRLMLVPDLLWDVKGLTLAMLDQVTKGLEKRAELEAAAKAKEKEASGSDSGRESDEDGDDGESAPSDGTSPDGKVAAEAKDEEEKKAPAMMLRANIDIDRPQLCLVEHPNEKDSRGLVITSIVGVEFSMKEGEQHAKVVVRDVRLFKCRLTSQDTTLVEIISPFSLRASFDSVSETKLALAVDMDAVGIMFSYNDFKLLMSLKDSWLSVIAPSDEENTQGDEKKKDEEKKALLEKESDDPDRDEEQKGTSEENDDTEASDDRELARMSSSGIQPHMLEMLQFKASGVDIQLLNDCFAGSGSGQFNSPIAHFAIASVGAEVYNWSTRLSGDAHVTGFSAEYYNSNLNVSEPMIEPWSMSLSVLQSDGMKVFLKAEELLNVNFTRAFVETMLRAFESFQKDYYDEAKTSRANHPFYIRNFSGIDVTYWITGSKERTQLLPGTETPFEVLGAERASRSGKRLQATEMHRTLCMDLLIEHGQVVLDSIYNLPFNELSYFVFTVGENSQAMKLVYSVQFRAGSKVLTIGSDLVVRNDTTSPVEINITDVHGKSQALLGPVGVGEQRAVPVALSRSDCSIAVRPCKEGSSFAWSKEKLVCGSISAKSVGKELMCETEDGYWVCGLKVIGQRAERDGRSAKAQELVLILTTRLVLQNRLPFDLEFKLVDLDKSEITLMSGTIARGENHHVHEVSRNVKIGISIRLPGFQWSSARKIQPRKEGKEFVLKESDTGKSLSLRGGMMPNEEGVMVVPFYATYWIFNQTGEYLLYSHDTKNIASGQAELQQQDCGDITAETTDDEGETVTKERVPVAVPWLFSNNKLFMQVRDRSEWSTTIGLGTSSGIIGIPSKDKRQQFQFGITVKTAPGKYVRTQIIRITPRFIFLNRCGYPLELKQHGVDDAAVVLRGDEQRSFSWPSASAEERLRIRPQGATWSWTSPLEISQVTSYQVRTYGEQSQEKIMRIITQLDHATLIVSFQESVGQKYADYVIENESSYDFTFRQAEGGVHDVAVAAGESRVFTWDVPSQADKEVQMTYPAMNPSRISLDVLRYHSALQIPTPVEGAPFVGRRVDARGPSKVLYLFDIADVTEYRKKIAADRAKAQAKKKQGEGHDARSSGGGEGDAVVEKKRKVEISASIELAGLGLSVVDETPRELLFLFLSGVAVSFEQSDVDRRIDLSVGHMQIDNQLYGTPYPIMFYGIPVPGKPFFQASAIMDTQHSEILFFEYFGVLIQSMDVMMDEMLLLALLRFADVATVYLRQQTEQEQERAVLREPASYQVANISAVGEGMMLYFEWLQINAIQVNLSFITLGAKSQSGGGGYLEAMLRTGGFLANIDNVPLRLNGLLFEHPFCSQSELIGRITSHYTDAGMREVFKILGSADILGSPVSLVSTLGTGVHDFFVEPSSATNPQELVTGLAKGTTSLVKNSVYGVFNSVSKVTGSVTQAATALSMDDEWQRERAKRARHQPKHVGQGLAHGARDLGKGIVSGLTGVVSQPIKGAMEEGGLGFVKGIGKGITGAVLKPVVGVVDTVSDLATGIKNTTTLFDEQTKAPVRLPRYFGADKLLKGYDPHEATGQMILRTVAQGLYEEQYFVYFSTIDGGKEGKQQRHLLLSDKCLFYFAGDLSGDLSELSIKWHCEYSKMTGVSEDNDAIVVGQSGSRDIFITVKSPDARKEAVRWIASGIRKQKTAIEEFNALHKQGEDTSMLADEAEEQGAERTNVDEDPYGDRDGTAEISLDDDDGRVGFEEVPLVGAEQRKKAKKSQRKNGSASGAASEASETTALLPTSARPSKRQNVEDVGCCYAFSLTGMCCGGNDDSY